MCAEHAVREAVALALELGYKTSEIVDQGICKATSLASVYIMDSGAGVHVKNDIEATMIGIRKSDEELERVMKEIGV